MIRTRAMVKAEANKAVDKLHIREAIVVEGRDDVDAVSKACDALIIATHGFGITGDTWALIEKAYDELGIIIMTDPDYSGEEIRRRLTAKFPNALHAYMPRSEAIRAGDIGIENAAPEAIRMALSKVHGISENSERAAITMADLTELKLVGYVGASALRESVGAELGIGCGNGKAFLRKLNGFGISRADLEQVVTHL